MSRLVDQLPMPSTVQVAGRARGQVASPLDGRYGPMDPAALRLVVNRLVECIELSEVKYVVGIPEGGLVPAYAFGDSAGLPVVLASILQTNLPGQISFSEDHDTPGMSRKYIYGLSPGDRVVVVEDEVTSGNTVINCVRALRACQIHCDQIAAIYAMDDPGLRSRLAAESIELHAASFYPKDIGDKLYL